MKIRIMAMVLAPAMLGACGSGGSGDDASSGSTAPGAPVATRPAPAPLAGMPPVSFGTCNVCHSVEAGSNRVGPSVYGIVGSKAGAVPGFAFSPALKASGIVWTRETLDTWLQGPMKMVPGTRMVQAVPDAARRKEVIDYLETLK